ncbi:MauE/DoxX family redox-associated membrane protein [Methylorubrum extorquens]|uniref:Methylamine utilization protein MauE n=1 Tax=Methylorubrum extorquens (strain CM4 / NCIMB 13688) TaxID=440085 RepID=B7L1U6_METC4|nr:MauE/DoxX family redox-associated membrane protein [Methylorubrum extorquens]ACK81490.1 methylamine utilisation MauE [Methylorubrum extorquens CM4]
MIMALLAEPVVTTFVRAFLILLLASAAIPKLRHGEEFFGVVRNFRLMPEWLARPFASVLPWLELGLAVGLMFPVTAPYAAGLTGGLLVLFGLAIAVNVARGRTAIDCGCFRNGMKQRLSWLLVGRNGGLALTAFGLAWLLPVAPAAGPFDLAIGFAAAGLTMLLIYGASLLNGLQAGARSSQLSKG